MYSFSTTRYHLAKDYREQIHPHCGNLEPYSLTSDGLCSISGYHDRGVTLIDVVDVAYSVK